MASASRYRSPGRRRRTDSTDSGGHRLRRQHLFEPLERPVELFAGDHQRRRQADDVLVGLLAQQATVAKRLAETAGATGLRHQLDTDP